MSFDTAASATPCPFGPVRFVFFDVGGTLLRVEPSVGTVYAGVAREHGVRVDPEALDHRFRDAWKKSLARSRERSFRCSDAILREEWLGIVTETFGGEVPAPLLERIFTSLYERFVSAAAWHVVPGAKDTLASLRDRGVRLGILSNWDSRLRRTLEEIGLAQFFATWIISHEIGYEKPHDRIFTEALRRAGERPAAILHVGDSLEADIRPARRLGWRTLWIGVDPASSSLEGDCARDFLALGEADWDRFLGERG